MLKKIILKKLTLLIPFLALFYAFTASAKVYQVDFDASKESMWRASLIALSKYPLDVTNFDEGLIKTSTLTEGDYWRPLFRDLNREYLYTLEVQVFESSTGTRVVVEKNLKRKSGFNRNEQALETLGVEEDMILYRVQRELNIDRYIKRLN
jgi:hypothetical protein